jgi:hypothetical protein
MGDVRVIEEDDVDRFTESVVSGDVTTVDEGVDPDLDAT